MKIAIMPIDSHAIYGEKIRDGMGFAYTPAPAEFARKMPVSIVDFSGFATLDINGLPSIVLF